MSCRGLRPSNAGTQQRQSGALRVQLSDDANLGQDAAIGSRRNLAIAYRTAGRLADAERVLRES